MTQLTTIDTNNYAAMAKAMGIAGEGPAQKQKSSSLARLRINHSAIMGQTEVKGKTVNMEVVSGGTYKLEIPDGDTLYAPSIKLRPFLQRFMYKRFVKGVGDKPNRYVKTLMNDDLNVDLKDNDGGFNCGKPAGYIQDFKALPQKTQDLIRQIKRVRVVLGTVELIDAVTSNGDAVDVEPTPFIWEIDNRDAFKIVGDSFASLKKMQRMPLQHIITANTQERKLPNGNAFYLPTVSLDVSKTIDITDKDQEMFMDFMSWVDNYNSYIANTWAEKANSSMEEDDEVMVAELVDIEEDEVA
jgi:hypothetical protein